LPHRHHKSPTPHVLKKKARGLFNPAPSIMHQVIGSVRKKRAAAHSKLSPAGWRESNPNAALSEQIGGSNDPGFGRNPQLQDFKDRNATKSCNLAVREDENQSADEESQELRPLSPMAANRGGSPGLDSQTYSQISQLLEIRRDTMNPNASSSAHTRRGSVSGMFRRTYSLAKRRNSRITAMMVSDDEKCLPSVAVFHPYSGPRMVWDLTIIFMILYTAIVVPLRLSWTLPETVGVWTLDRLLDLVFMIDILINFNTAFERGTELVLDRRSILIHYLKTWFALDFIASFPFDFFISLLNGGSVLSYKDEQQNTSLSLLPRLVRLFKLSRLFRLARLQRILRRVQLQLGIRNSTNKILKFSGAAILCAHWMACMFYATSTFGGSADSKLGDFPSWVERLDQDNRDQLDAHSVAHTYIAALYWSLTTMTSIGYGDVAPKTPSERIFGIFGMICGAVLFGHFMGNVLAVVADMSPAENEFHLKMDMLNVYMKEQNLNTELRRQIEEFYHIEHKLNNHQVDEAEMLKELPDRLKRELSLAISRRILGNVPLFEGMSSSFIRTVGLSMERRVYPQGEFVIREGNEVNKFYILTAGRACLLQDDQVIGSVRNGEHFGSIPIHLNQLSATPFKSAYSVRTLEWTEVRSLSISIFRQLIGQFPDAKGVLVQRIADNLFEQTTKTDVAKSSSQTRSPLKLNKSPSKEFAKNGAEKQEIIQPVHDAPRPVNDALSADEVDVDSHSVLAEMVSIPQRRPSISIDRQQLIKFVENALSLDQTQQADASLRMENGEDDADSIQISQESSIVRGLKEMEVDRRGTASREQLMRQRVGEELRSLDSLVAMISLMANNSHHAAEHYKSMGGLDEQDERDDNERQKELLQYIRYIGDRRLLSKVSTLRKVLQYVLEPNNTTFGDHEDSKQNGPAERSAQDAVESRVESDINAFFRPIVFMKSPDSIKEAMREPAAPQRGLSRTHRESSVAAKAFTNRVLYHGESAEFNESMELMLFKLGYRPTFSNSNSKDLETVIARNHFDVIMVDSDDLEEIKKALQVVSAPKHRASVNVLFLVSNCTQFAKLAEVAKKYGVQIILRKPMVFQDLQNLFKQCGLYTRG